MPKDFGQSGVGPDVQIGKDGPRLIGNSGVVQNRDKDNANFARVQGGDSVSDDDLLTRRQWNQHAALRQLIHLADEGGPFELFAAGSFLETLPAGNPFPTSAIWYTDATKSAKIVEKLITRNPNQTPSTIVRRVYDTDGSTVLVTATDTISYSGIIEISRTRVLS